MDATFKQKLLTLRSPHSPKTFSEALLERPLWSESIQRNKTKIFENNDYSERKLVLDSFERFVKEEVQEKQNKVLGVEGGEIAVKGASRENKDYDFSCLEELLKEVKIESKIKEIIFKDKKPQNIEVIFVSEKLRHWNDILPQLQEGPINELIVGLNLKTAIFFERMIKAMKLSPDEIIILPVETEQEEDISEDIFKVASYMNPRIIITLGAKATSKILNSNDRLSMIHGQFFSKVLGDKSFQVVPLFHPSIIETNQNMKKTAWVDMQKMMKFLKKIP